MLGFAWWLRGQILNDYAEFKAFCGATHRGETWAHVQERAAPHDWAKVRQSREGALPEEWLWEREFFSYRAGCVVELDNQGRVLKTRFAELPKK